VEKELGDKYRGAHPSGPNRTRLTISLDFEGHGIAK
jgi:hypothetical protein